MIRNIDTQRITATIEAVEKKTSGEIFCVIARHSGDYRFVPLVYATGIALLLPFPLLLLGHWPAHDIYIAQLIAFVVAVILCMPPGIRYRIVPTRLKHMRAHAEALRQFEVQGLHRTAQRTGVLIFVSVAERYAEIVADAGINEKVQKSVWDDAIAHLIEAIKRDAPTEGFVAAIEECGGVLARHFPPGALNRDELPNRVIEI